MMNERLSDKTNAGSQQLTLEASIKRALLILGSRSESYERCGAKSAEHIIDWAISVVRAAASQECLDMYEEEAYDVFHDDYIADELLDSDDDGFLEDFMNDDSLDGLGISDYEESLEDDCYE